MHSYVFPSAMQSPALHGSGLTGHGSGVVVGVVV